MQAANNKLPTPLVVIAREFGIPVKDMKGEAEKLSERDRKELASAIARQNGIPGEECGWEMVEY
jgi:hypothetical protein